MTALLDPSKDPKEVLADAQKALALPIGAASPLWLMFAGAASAGVAYWWFNRWRNVTNLEAVLAPALATPQPDAALVVPEVVEPAVVEVFEAAADSVADAAPEPVIEPAPEPVVEAAPEAVLEVSPTPKPAPKPKSKAAAVRAAPRTTSGPTRRS
jgi:outer membrane biosynthesis protein TonB